MLAPDAPAEIGACLARLSALEAQRMADLLRETKAPAQRVAVQFIVEQQQAAALAFATRTIS